jgi:hypothetical protein
MTTYSISILTMVPQQITLPTLSGRDPLPPRYDQLKRTRAVTMTTEEPTLPPQRRLKKAPPLKAVKAFMFTGIHPLF